MGKKITFQNFGCLFNVKHSSYSWDGDDIYKNVQNKPHWGGGIPMVFGDTKRQVILTE